MKVKEREQGIGGDGLPRPACRTRFQAIAIDGLPEIGIDAQLGRLLTAHFDFEAGDVLLLAQKIVSKAEGRLVRLNSVQPSVRALELAREAEKDARLVQLILDESRQVMRVRPGVIIVEDRRGWVCANAGIDRSNIVQESGEEVVGLLPLDPDASAEAVRDQIRANCGVAVAVIITDSHGRAWREGTVGVAIGVAGIDPVADRRGRTDRQGYILRHTLVATADEMAAAASILMGQEDQGFPAVVLRGLEAEGNGKAVDLQRPRERDLFR